METQIGKRTEVLALTLDAIRRFGTCMTLEGEVFRLSDGLPWPLGEVLKPRISEGGILFFHRSLFAFLDSDNLKHVVNGRHFVFVSTEYNGKLRLRVMRPNYDGFVEDAPSYEADTMEVHHTPLCLALELIQRVNSDLLCMNSIHRGGGGCDGAGRKAPDRHRAVLVQPGKHGNLDVMCQHCYEAGLKNGSCVDYSLSQTVASNATIGLFHGKWLKGPTLVQTYDDPIVKRVAAEPPNCINPTSHHGPNSGQTNP